MEKKKTVLILSSPTGSGKTQVACNVARITPVEIISADSRQIYKYLSIGTSKPTHEERSVAFHHFVDKLEPHETWNAGKFSQEARQIIPDIFEREKIPFIVGGTGLYIKALVDGIIDMPEADLTLRERISRRLEQEGLKSLVEELKKVDPAAAKTIDIKNPRRVMRALEIYHMTGMSRAELEEKSNNPLPYRILWFGLQWDRGKLYDRIERRIDNMIEQGLIDEVRSIINKGYSKETHALQTVGYSETIDYIDNKINREELLHQIKQNTRQYAKRQMTWFGKDKRIRWMDIDSEEDLANAAHTIVKQYRENS